MSSPPVPQRAGGELRVDAGRIMGTQVGEFAFQVGEMKSQVGENDSQVGEIHVQVGEKHPQVAEKFFDLQCFQLGAFSPMADHKS